MAGVEVGCTRSAKANSGATDFGAASVGGTSRSSACWARGSTDGVGIDSGLTAGAGAAFAGAGAGVSAVRLGGAVIAGFAGAGLTGAGLELSVCVAACFKVRERSPLSAGEAVEVVESFAATGIATGSAETVTGLAAKVEAMSCGAGAVCVCWVALVSPSADVSCTCGSAFSGAGAEGRLCAFEVATGAAAGAGARAGSGAGAGAGAGPCICGAAGAGVCRFDAGTGRGDSVCGFGVATGTAESVTGDVNEGVTEGVTRAAAGLCGVDACASAFTGCSEAGVFGSGTLPKILRDHLRGKG